MLVACELFTELHLQVSLMTGLLNMDGALDCVRMASSTVVDGSKYGTDLDLVDCSCRTLKVICAIEACDAYGGECFNGDITCSFNQYLIT